MVVFPHFLAVLLILFLVPLAGFMLLSLLFLIILSLLYFLSVHIFQKLHHAVIGIQRDSTNNWLITTAKDKNKAFHSELLSSSFVSPWLVILNFKGNHKLNAYTALIPLGSLPEDDFRRLRVILKTMKNKKR